MTLGERLRRAREIADLTQTEAAREILDPMPDGTYRYQTISEWERGLRTPSAPELALACEIYGVSGDWLLLGRGAERPVEPDQNAVLLEAIRRLVSPEGDPMEAIRELVRWGREVLPEEPGDVPGEP